MNSLSPVCILTAGKGTRMGALSPVINKALLPLNGKAIISHIIERFPAQTTFVIALGHLGSQVQEYLAAAHPDIKFQYVTVDRYEGDGTGPGYSLLCCRDALLKPFYFVSCDTLFEKTIEISSASSSNWVGIAAVSAEAQNAYCNMVLGKNNQVIAIHDKASTNANASAFIGLMHIYDYEDFWDGLTNNIAIAGEHQISNGLGALVKKKQLQSILTSWQDVGDYQKYTALVNSENYDFSKINEFIYFINGKVIKFFSDKNIVANRVKKTNVNPSVFPKISYTSAQFYSYPFNEGKTLYVYNTPLLFSKLLNWLDNNLWKPANVSHEKMHTLCKNFYQQKTLARIQAFENKHPNDVSLSKVNGEAVLSAKEIIKQLPWDELCNGVPSFIHGDLQFDNILYNPTTDNFLLLDWRQDFAGEINFGDLYYDLAKLLGGIILNYDYVKSGLFSVSDAPNELLLDFAKRFSSDNYRKILENFVTHKQFNMKKIELLVGLIYLNMSPLHHFPFDRMLYGLGRLLLTKILLSNK